MSAGLMSCVRENSPPLEIDTMEQTVPPDTPETQKRRRFHPLRNLRRIFRRRTVSHADHTTINHISSPTSTITSSRSAIAAVATAVTHDSQNCYRNGSGRPDGVCHGNIGLISGSISAAEGFYLAKEKREHSADCGRRKEVVQELERDMTDYQRSLSEGRLMDSDFSRDALSQSHDSVFSDSATASSLSIVLKAELVDALRKRRNRPDASDEDLGLPCSPSPPKHNKERKGNQSEGSISLLSATSSSDMMDDDGIYGGQGLNSSYTSSGKLSSQNTSRSSEDDDLMNISMESNGSRLSHSAARHKMAVRPKKKGPSRHYRRQIESTILPSMPEVNEDILRLRYPVDINSSSGTKIKSQSLPPGMNAKVMEKHAENLTESSSECKPSSAKKEKMTSNLYTKHEQSIMSSIASSIYVNKNLAKSHDFERKTEQITATTERKEEEGLFKRLFNLSTKKRSIEPLEQFQGKDVFDNSGIKRIDVTGGYAQQGPTPSKFDNQSQFLSDKNKSQIVTVKPIEINGSGTSLLNQLLERDQPFKNQKSGPAARQRYLPQDINQSKHSDETIHSDMNPEMVRKHETVTEKLPPKMPKSTTVTTTINEGAKYFGSKSKQYVNVFSDPTAGTTIDIPREGRFIKATQHRSEEVLAAPKPRPRLLSSSDQPHSISPPKSSQWIETNYQPPQSRTFGLYPFQERLSQFSNDYSTVDVEQSFSPRRKAVEKSKSFRVYTENTNDNLFNSNNMPSLPDLSDKQIERPQFLSMSASLKQYNRDSSGSLNDSAEQLPKFEINDNNLMRSREGDGFTSITHSPNFTKNILLTTTTNPTPSLSNQNITQIEDNIDKIMKSSLVTVLKKSSTTDLFEIKPRSNISITSISSSGGGNPIDNQKEIVDSTSPTKSRSNSQNSDDSPGEKNDIPEFMKVQLNRIDSTRPKSHIVLSKTGGNRDSVESKPERRFSNESVEINDKKSGSVTILPDVIPKDEDLTKSNDSLSNTPKGIVNRRIFAQKFSSNIERISTGSMNDITKVDKILNDSKKETNKINVIVERRKSVTDEKNRFEKKIEELRAERKKSIATEEVVIRKQPIDDDNVVVLRRKSLIPSNKDQDTPELMKVFARRSLKIKDTDDYSSLEATANKPSNIQKEKQQGNVDSDKENQSSSEEKLDKLPKIEITIQNKLPNGNTPVRDRIDDKLPIIKKLESPLNTTNDAIRKSNIPIAKPFVTANRFGNNIRNTGTFMENRQKLLSNGASPIKTNSIETNNNNNNLNNSNNNFINNRHTINVPTPIVKRDDGNGTEEEFKGILQRRAEWEKRAKEAFK